MTGKRATPRLSSWGASTCPNDESVATPVFPSPVSAELASIEHGDLGIDCTGVDRMATSMGYAEKLICASLPEPRQLSTHQCHEAPPTCRFRLVRVLIFRSSIDGLLR